ncbi:Aste57867_25005 [Aphanomyces stellatus]|uniref:Aste57867_25005 protein n=1 Tax=Aphanomyces stellatus TaxID=120398 RepID=A0A485LS11_9STRA|nr:hypothetical protein As57867_024927 [Aphanomyces stellatus]VFU01636.1 Aste57867_25005 [Aphanomyces stellatus]
MDIPVVDCFATDAAAQMRQACMNVGFFYLKDHRIPADLLAALYDEMQNFFTQSEAEKRKVLANANMRGYTPMNEETLDPAVQTQGDTKEGYYICREAHSDELHLPLHGSNVFPNPLDYPSFRTVTETYFSRMSALGFHVAQLFATAAGADGAFDGPGIPMAALRLLHYSNRKSDVGGGIFGAGAHSDYGLLTLLSTDENPGLEILHEGEWVAVPAKADCFIVNIGDLGGMLTCVAMHWTHAHAPERWTNGLFKSTRHRVVNRLGVERYSVPFFYEPNFTCQVTCLPSCVSDTNPAKYGSITSGQHLLDKYRETHDSFDAQANQ